MRQTAVLLLLLATCSSLQLSQGADPSRWWAYSAGSVPVGKSVAAPLSNGLSSGDAIWATALDGHSRYVFGQLGASSVGGTPVAFSTSGMNLDAQQENSIYIAKIEAGNTATFTMPPKPCNENIAILNGQCLEATKTATFPYHQDEIDNLLAFEVVDGTPAMMYQLDGYDKPFFFSRYADWTIAVEGLPYRKANNLNPDDATNGDASEYYFTTKDSVLNYLASTSANGTMYALFNLEGVAKIARRYDNGTEGRALLVNGTSLFAGTVSGTDPFDTEDTSLPAADKKIIRKGYFIMAVDSVSGDVKYITPIWGQDTVHGGASVSGGDIDTSGDIGMAASAYDNALYIFADLFSRIVIGDPIALPMYSNATSGRYVFDTFPATSTQVAVTREATVIPFTADRVRVLLGLDGSGKYRSSKTFKLSTDVTGEDYNYVPGKWEAIRADDNSTAVYIAATLVNSAWQDALAGALALADTNDADKLSLNSEVYSLSPDGPGSAGTDYSDAFIAKFDGAALADASWVYQVKGIDDLALVTDFTVANGTVYALVAFTNTTILPKTAASSPDASLETAIYGYTAGNDLVTGGFVPVTSDDIQRRRRMLSSSRTRSSSRASTAKATLRAHEEKKAAVADPTQVGRDLLAVSLTEPRPNPEYIAQTNSVEPDDATYRDAFLLILGSDGSRSDDVPTFHGIGSGATGSNGQSVRVEIAGVGAYEGKVYVHGTFYGGITFQSKGNGTAYVQDVSIHSRKPSQASVFWAVYADSLPAASAVEEDDDDDDDRALALGLGIGLGVPFVLALIAGIAYLITKGGAAGAGSAVVKPAEPA